jgi:4-methyl-5(b-hydroxyethyl)-thiazole monophosphate biosynthesis
MKALVPIADGTEETEAVSIIDVLRRAGTDVTVASVNDLQVTCSRGVKLTADKPIEQCSGEAWDLIALPGGTGGAENLRDSETLVSMLREHAGSGRLLGAICAAPALVLETHGLIKGRKATCHPSFADRLSNQEEIESRVVADENLVTSRGPGTAIEFALKLVELLYGRQKAEEVEKPMITLTC